MRKLFDLTFAQGDDILLKNTSEGDLLLSPTGKGEFCGEGIRGRIVPVGMGITFTPESGRNTIESSLLLETDDGVKILMKLKAFLNLPEELEEKFLREEKVDPREYYYKGTVEFYVEKSAYSWLENRVFLCEGIIDSWEVLSFQVYEA